MQDTQPPGRVEWQHEVRGGREPREDALRRRAVALGQTQVQRPLVRKSAACEAGGRVGNQGEVPTRSGQSRISEILLNIWASKPLERMKPLSGS